MAAWNLTAMEIASMRSLVSAFDLHKERTNKNERVYNLSDGLQDNKG